MIHNEKLSSNFYVMTIFSGWTGTFRWLEVRTVVLKISRSMHDFGLLLICRLIWSLFDILRRWQWGIQWTANWKQGNYAYNHSENREIADIQNKKDMANFPKI